MESMLMKGVIRNGRVEVAEPINLPDGSEVTIAGQANGNCLAACDQDRPMSAAEIAVTLAAMTKVEPFDMSAEERANADAWEKKVNDYAIANVDRGLEDVFR
jgi:hypothetical protein